MLYRVADGVADVSKAVQEHLAARADLIKVMSSGGVFEPKESESWVQFTDTELEEVIWEAKAQGKRVAAHAHPTEAIRRAILLGVSSIEQGSSIDSECAGTMAERHVPVNPTFTVYKLLGSHPGYPRLHERAWRLYESKFAPFVKARKIGTPWGVGSPYSNLFAEPEAVIDEIGILSGETGLPTVDVLTAATEVNATIIGIQDRVGTVAAGMDADLIVVGGNPLNDPKVLQRVPITVTHGIVDDSRQEGA